MAQVLKIKRSNSTALVDGSSSLDFGVLAITDISDVRRFYVGDEDNLAREIGGDAFAKLASPAFTGTPTAPTAASGTNTTQLATTAFVQAAIAAAVQGLIIKNAVVAATTGALPAYTYDNGTSGVGATITADANGALPAQDGITLSQNDRLLVKDEAGANAPYNGIYEVTEVGDGSNPFVLTRVADFDDVNTIKSSSFVFVEQGSSLADSGWVLATDGSITVGTTDLTFTQFSGAGQITAGSGLSKSGNTLSLNVDNSTIEVNGSDQAQVKDSGITNAKLAGSITDDKLNQITSANKVAGSAVQIKSGAALSDDTGLQVNVDGTSIANNSGTLEVGTVDAGTF